MYIFLGMSAAAPSRAMHCVLSGDSSRDGSAVRGESDAGRDTRGTTRRLCCPSSARRRRRLRLGCARPPTRRLPAAYPPIHPDTHPQRSCGRASEERPCFARLLPRQVAELEAAVAEARAAEEVSRAEMEARTHNHTKPSLPPPSFYFLACPFCACGPASRPALPPPPPPPPAPCPQELRGGGRGQHPSAEPASPPPAIAAANAPFGDAPAAAQRGQQQKQGLSAEDAARIRGLLGARRARRGLGFALCFPR